MAAGLKAAAVWQVSQVAVVAMCVADLPLADLPLWQLAQPVVTPVWSNYAPKKLAVEV